MEYNILINGLLQQDSGRRCHPLDYPPSERNCGGLNVMMGFFFLCMSKKGKKKMIGFGE